MRAAEHRRTFQQARSQSHDARSNLLEHFRADTRRALDEIEPYQRMMPEPSRVPAIGPHMSRSDAKTILYAWLFSHDLRQSQAAAQALAEEFPRTHCCDVCTNFVRQCTTCPEPHWLHHNRMGHRPVPVLTQDVQPRPRELATAYSRPWAWEADHDPVYAVYPGNDSYGGTGKGDPLPDTTARYNALMAEIDEVLNDS